jgi:zinc protease
MDIVASARAIAARGRACGGALGVSALVLAWCAGSARAQGGAAVAPSASAAPSTSSAGGKIGGFFTHRLDNGLTVIVQEDHRLPLASVVLRYDVGTRAAPLGAPEVAPITFELMLSRSKHAPQEGQARSLLHAAGADLASTTKEDLSFIAMTLPAQSYELPLWLLSDQMGFFRETLDDQAIAKYVAWLDGAARRRREQTPTGRLDEMLREELFPVGHPYHASMMADDGQRSPVDRKAVLAFFDRWMTPDHATLVIVGDLVMKDVLAAVDKYFGPIPASVEHARIELGPPTPLPGEVRVDFAANVPVPQVTIGWPSARYMTSEDGALDVVARRLTGQHVALLRWALVDKKRVARSVYAQQESNALGSRFTVTIEGVANQTPEGLLGAFDDAMAEAKNAACTQEEVGHSATEVFLDRGFAIDSPRRRAEHFALYQGLVGVPGYFMQDFRRFAVTCEGLAALTARTLSPDRRVVVLVTPTPGARPGGERTGRRVIPARTK